MRDVKFSIRTVYVYTKQEWLKQVDYYKLYSLQNEITDMPISYSANTLEHVVKECKKQPKQLKSNCTNINSEPMDIKQIFAENQNIQIVPELTREEFHKLLQEQETKYFTKEQPYVKNEKANSVTTITKLINSVCHPDILSAISDKLLKDWIIWIVYCFYTSVNSNQTRNRNYITSIFIRVFVYWILYNYTLSYIYNINCIVIVKLSNNKFANITQIVSLVSYIHPNI